MQAILKKQFDTLNRLEGRAKMDTVIQLAQLYKSNRIDDDGDRVEGQLKDLNSNIVKLLQKLGGEVTSGDAVTENDKVEDPRQFNTLKPRVENFKEGFKDFFTMRGFMDKTRIAPRGAGDIVSEYLDRNEARSKSQTPIQQQDEVSSESTPLTQTPTKVSSESTTFTGASASAGGLAAASEQENMLEQNRMVAQQTILLTKIEENTRALTTTPSNVPTMRQPEAASGGGLMDMGRRGAGRLGRIATTAGRGLMTGVKAAGGFLAKRAGPVAALSAVGAGAFAGYKGFSAAGDKEQSALKEIDTKVASGEISEEQAQGLREESRKTGTIERSSSAGKGTGMAVGGVGGALKGAAVGAAIGSAVPIVGTVIGGAIGAGLGAVGGSVLGGKAGEFLGDKFGKAKNFLFGKSGDSDTKVEQADVKETSSSVNIRFSEMAFSQNDPDNYAKFRVERDALIEKYANDSFKKYKARGGTRPHPTQQHYSAAKLKANAETIPKYKKEIEAAGAGKITGGKKEQSVVPGDKTTEALKKTAEGVTPSAPESTRFRRSETPAARDRYLDRNNLASGASAKVLSVAPISTAQTGNIISKQSGDNEQAKMDANKGGNNTAIVAAPTVNNNNTVQNSPVKLPPRNNDSTVNKYMQSRWAY